MMLKEIIKRIQINVKQGSSSLTVDKEDGSALLLDTGEYMEYDKVIEALKNEKLKSLSICLTHWHTDHYGGLIKVIEYCLENNIAIDNLVLPKVEDGKNKEIQKVLDKIFIMSVEKEIGNVLFKENIFSEAEYKEIIDSLIEDYSDKIDHTKKQENVLKRVSKTSGIGIETIREFYNKEKELINEVGLDKFLAQKFLENKSPMTRQFLLNKYKKIDNSENSHVNFEKLLKNELKEKGYKINSQHTIKNLRLIERRDEVISLKVSKNIKVLLTAPAFSERNKKNKSLYTENNKGILYAIKMKDFYHSSFGDLDANGKFFIEKKFSRYSEIFANFVNWTKKSREKDAEHHGSDNAVREQNDEKLFPNLETIIVSALNGVKGEHPGSNFIKLCKEKDYIFFLTELEGNVVERIFEDGTRYFQSETLIKKREEKFIEEGKKISEIKDEIAKYEKIGIDKTNTVKLVYSLENIARKYPILKELKNEIDKGIKWN